MHTDRQLLTGYTWFSSLVLASMSRRAAFSCIGCRSVGGSSSSCAVSCTQSSTGSARTISPTSWARLLRSSTSRSSIFVVVGLLSAAVTHQARRACLHVCRPVCGTHCRRTYVPSPILDFLENDSRPTFLVWRFVSADNSDDSVMHLWPIVVIGALQILVWWWW